MIVRETPTSWRVVFEDVFCPRLSHEDAVELDRRIRELAELRGAAQARIRLAYYCVLSVANS